MSEQKREELKQDAQETIKLWAFKKKVFYRAFVWFVYKKIIFTQKGGKTKSENWRRVLSVTRPKPKSF